MTIDTSLAVKRVENFYAAPLTCNAGEINSIYFTYSTYKRKRLKMCPIIKFNKEVEREEIFQRNLSNLCKTRAALEQTARFYFTYYSEELFNLHWYDKLRE